jgi:hypothetical protein
MRDFITLVGGTAMWPLANVPHLVTAFRQGLKEVGFVDGQNVAVEYRSASALRRGDVSW